MEVTPLAIPAVLAIVPARHRDARGFLSEGWNQARFDQAVGRPVRFVQDNHSHSVRGVLRGLHYQVGQVQGKLVRAVAGAVFDVAVDLRRGAPTFGHWVGLELSAENGRQMWVPEGFAHGFYTLTDSADVIYKMTDYWAAQHERSIAWDDPDIGIDWPLQGPPILGPRDQGATAFKQAEVFENLR